MTIHMSVPGVPRWARIAAWTITLAVLPASLWRIGAMTFHLPIITPSPIGPEPTLGMPGELYVVLLSIFSEAAAFTAFGLIAGWGEVFPSWIPGLGGRRVPPLAAVVPAALGAAVLTWTWTFVTVNILRGHDVHGRALPSYFPLNFDDWKGVLAVAAYAPLLLWGPLLAVLTVAYWRRRHRPSR
ncbi:hypothetical protein [Nonomuraea insulae]|uniref:DUF3995 domain-containing protein n=1 Tax=Nonomuraea insulae TaxID=1616787 RepID=A0ABW1D9W1_9ACTN